jgi:AbrB family looped-hinge helix DNA binding protein
LALTVIPKIGNTFYMKHESNMTSKGQVTVPKDIRDALGLLAGKPVRFEIDDDGNARILKSDHDDSIEARKTQIRQRLQEVRAKYTPREEFRGMDGLEYQRWIRGDGPEV